MSATRFPTLHAALSRLVDRTGAALAVAATVVDAAGTAVLDECVVAGAHAGLIAAADLDGEPIGFGREGDGEALAELLGWDQVRCTGRRRFAGHRWAERLAPLGVTAVMATGLTTRGTVIGGCWVFGARPFRADHARVFALAATELADAFEERRPARAFALLVGADAAVRPGCPAARRWLDQGHRADVVVARARTGGVLGGACLRHLPAEHADTQAVIVVTPAPAAVPATSMLSPAQREIARYAAAGATVAEAASAVGIATETARTHLRDAYRRLDVANRVELAEALRGAHGG